MSWFQENKFSAVLGGSTLIGLVILYVVGSSAASKYEESKLQFDEAAGEASSYEELELYPKAELRDGKKKALDDYKRSLQTLQTAFAPFRTEKFTDISPQDFTNRLLAANQEITTAFSEAGVVIPEQFFSGFTKYRTTLAAGNMTGVLDFQLDKIKNVLLLLAEAKPTELKNLHRPALIEEENGTYVPGDNVARPFPLELTFVGTEKSLSEFLSNLTSSTKQYCVIRSMRITNQKKEPPRAADAKFEKAEVKSKPADAFSGGFVLPEDEPPADAPVEEAPVAEAPKSADSSKILSQVLGNEQLNVFIRLDILQFLPVQKLP